jgi:hypothetical protein
VVAVSFAARVAEGPPLNEVLQAVWINGDQ